MWRRAARGDGTGTYTLSVAEVPDDFAADTGTAGRVAVGGSATGEIEAARDVDWFAVELEVGKTYRIDLKGAPSSGGTLDNTLLRGIYDAEGKRIAGTRNDNGGEGADARLTFTATETATHYVAPSGQGDGTGTYTLSVACVDDFRADTGTAGRVTVGGSATGEIDSVGDHDWFAVELEAGKTYRVDLKGAPTGDGTLRDPALYGIYDADGILIDGTGDDNGGEGANGRVQFTAAEAATHYVAASGQGDGTGTYTVSVAEVPDDFAADTGTAGSVAVGGSATGEVEAARDVDWFAVELEAGKTYRIDLKGASTGDGTLGNPALHGIYDADGILIDGTADNDGGEGADARLTFTAANTATHYVAAGGQEDGTGTYTLSVACVDDFTADTGTVGRVAVGGSATGEIDTGGDRDWFAVELEEGKTYRIDLKGSPTSDGTLAHPNLFGIYDAGGKRIPGVSDYDGGVGSNSRVSFTATETAIHYVVAGGFDIHTHTYHTGTYTLSVACVDDFTADTGTVGRVAVGGSATGEIDTGGDRDWFAVELEAGKTYRIDLKGSPTSDGALARPSVYGIFDAGGSRIDGTGDNNGGEGANSRVWFTAAKTATHYVAASGQGDGTGTYTVSVAEVPDDFAADTGTAGSVAVGGSATGEVEAARDVDWFAVELEAGKTYRIDLKGAPSSDGTLRDPALYGLYDADGILIDGTGDDNGGEGANGRVQFTAAEAATHYVAASGQGDGTGTYTVSVAEVPDDFAADTGTAGSVAVGGSATGEVEAARDVDWFAVELEAGKTYRIDLKGAPTGDGTLAHPTVRGIFDTGGNRIDSAGTGRQVLFTAAETATHYVAASGQGDGTGTYTVSVACVDDFTADTGTAGRVAVGGSATGEVETRGDRDWFAVELEAGKTYRIDLKGAPSSDGTLGNPALYGLYDADGILIDGTGDDNGGEGANGRVWFTAADTATHYVAASGYGDGTGTYTLSVAEIPDDFAADTGTAGSVAVGGSATGEVEAARDVDWFAVELEAGKTYRIDLKGAPSSDGTLGNPALYGLYDADGILIDGTGDDNGGEGANGRVWFTAADTATHYVAASGYGDGTGTYTLSVTYVDDFTGDTGTVGQVSVGGSVTGEIEAARDVDWFAVEFEAGKTYRIDLKGASTGDGTLAHSALYGIFDAGGNRIPHTGDYGRGVGTNSQEWFTATETATYYVEAAGYDIHTRTHHTGTYTLSVAEAPEVPDDPASDAGSSGTVAVAVPGDDLPADTGTSGTVAVGGSATGELEYEGDYDWFAVELQEGKTYQIDLKGASANVGTLRDPHLGGIYDKNGTAVAGGNDDGGVGRASLLVFTASETATYYVAAGGRNAAGYSHTHQTGTYAVSVTEINADDYTGDFNTAGRVAVGGFATGEIESGGDRDWFAVEFEAGKTYRIDLKGTSTGDGTLADPVTGVFVNDGTGVCRSWDDNDGAGANALSHYTALASGTHYVLAAGAHEGFTGTYTVSVEEVVDAI